MTALCRLEDLEATGAKGVVLADGRDIVVVQAAGGVRAYINACPHVGIPLETFPDRFLTANRDFLVCSGHGALFIPETGLCVAGPCNRQWLTKVPVAIAEGLVCLAGSAK